MAWSSPRAHPEAVAAHPDSYTGHFLAPLLDGRGAKQPRGRVKPVEEVRPVTKAAAKKAAAAERAAKRAAAKAPAKKAAAKRTTTKKSAPSS